MKLELNEQLVDFADLNSYEDGRQLIASLPQEAFDEFVKMVNVTTTGDQWFDQLVELGMKFDSEEPEIDPLTAWLDNDN